MYNQKGFTLIELVMVILILGLLLVIAVPRFIDLAEQADKAVFDGMASTFKNGVSHVHIDWLVRGHGKAVLNFMKVPNPLAGGDLSLNIKGYPANTRGTGLTLNGGNDCLDVWRALIYSQDALVALDNSGHFEAKYNGGTCTYTYNKRTNLTINYNSNSGQVTIHE